jgi:hypothetical protein
MRDKEGGDARMPQVFLLDQFADGLNYAKYACDSLFRSLGGQRRRPGANYRKKFGHVVVFFTVY